MTQPTSMTRSSAYNTSLVKCETSPHEPPPTLPHPPSHPGPSATRVTIHTEACLKPSHDHCTQPCDPPPRARKVRRPECRRRSVRASRTIVKTLARSPELCCLSSASAIHSYHPNNLSCLAFDVDGRRVRAHSGTYIAKYRAYIAEDET